MALARINNTDLWNKVRDAFPKFANITSKVTSDFFTAQTFEKLKNHPDQVLNDFFELSLRVYLQLINISQAKDPLAENGFGEYYDQPRGGYIQRMAIDSVKPISPAYKNLENGNSIDPFIVRKPLTHERFFVQNFDYQSMITMPDDFQYKQIFISEYGMSELMAGIMSGLENGYTLQKYANKLQAINAGINSTQTPLLDTQKWVVPLSAEPTTDELTAFLLAVKNVVTAMTIAPQTYAFNAMHFASTQEKSRLKLLVRAGFKNEISVKLMAGAFNPENLSIPVDIIEVSDFGGLEPYKEATFTTKLYPVYDKLGAVIGYNQLEDQTSVEVEEWDVHWKDPNADVNAILADKGWIFETQQNPYTVEPIRNPRGLYTNYWASSPNNAIHVDPLYNVVVFKNK